MFCCRCGTEIILGAKYCHSCGDALPDSELKQSDSADVAPGTRERTTADANRCHKCGSSGAVHSWDFGLGKLTSSKREWGKTAISAALSAATVPLIGVGMLQLPGKRTTFSVLPLRLLLCDSCLRNREGYPCHPLWAEAQRLGFTEFFCAGDLERLRPVPRD